MDDCVDLRAELMNELAVGDSADHRRIGTSFDIQAGYMMIGRDSFGDTTADSSRCAGD